MQQSSVWWKVGSSGQLLPAPEVPRALRVGVAVPLALVAGAGGGAAGVGAGAGGTYFVKKNNWEVRPKRSNLRQQLSFSSNPSPSQFLKPQTRPRTHSPSVSQWPSPSSQGASGVQQSSAPPHFPRKKNNKRSSNSAKITGWETCCSRSSRRPRRRGSRTGPPRRRRTLEQDAHFELV